MTKKRIQMIYRIVLSAAIVIAGVCLIIACLSIYKSGDQPFSPESVAAAFRTVAIPVYLCLALVIGGFILEIFLPTEKKKMPVEKQYDLILARLQKKLDLESCDEKTREAILSGRKLRDFDKKASLVLLCICSGIFLFYGMNSANFHQSEINGSMLRAMYVFFPCLALPFGYALFSSYSRKRSIVKEIELIKSALTENKTAPEKTETAPEESKCIIARIRSRLLKNPVLFTRIVRYSLLGIGITLLVYGFFAGGTRDVLTKAVNICTECVGLG